MRTSDIGRPRSPTAGYAALTLLALLPLGVAMFASASAGNGPIAAAFPPWWSGARVFAAASIAGRVVRLGALPFVVVVSGADGARLRAAGAWLLLDPLALGGCAAPGVT